MKDNLDKLTLSLKDNEELAAYFAGKPAGHECTLTVKGRLDETTEDFAVISVKETEPSEYDDEEEDEATETEPVMQWAQKVSEEE